MPYIHTVEGAVLGLAAGTGPGQQSLLGPTVGAEEGHCTAQTAVSVV